MSDRNAAFGPTLLESYAGPARPTPLATISTARFEPIRTLGRGGMGEVILVRDRDIDRHVAVKRLRSDIEHGVERFRDEIRTVGQLEHPNIAAIHDVGIDGDGQHYFVMPFVDGETLESIIAKLGAGDREYHARFTYEVRLQIILGMLNALHYAHAKGVIHRDIKPANVMVGPFGEVLVMDWGIAKKLQSKPRVEPFVEDASDVSERDRMFRTRHGALLGTPAYMSPEQACGDIDVLDERSDLYSLCVVCFELMTLQHYLPKATTMGEMLAAVIAQPSPHASTVANPHQPPVPIEVGWLLHVGLAKDPRDRYESTAKMIDALNRVLAGTFQVHCFTTYMKRSGVKAIRFVEKHPRLVFAGGLLSATLAMTGVASLIALFM